ncbi:MAG: sigma-70 family RNA polymerase sigma factor [Acidimicrobiia bacterium]|nr:sigma-70 family RNA polymerase sigma factor [Acidimicrobiia bacterium]
MQVQPAATEADLLTEAAAGNPIAVRALLDGYGDALYGFLYARVGGHAPVAEDLLQETFLEAVRSASTFRGESSLKTWLCTIARRRLGRHYEAERKAAAARAGLALVADDPADDRHGDVERRDQITRALGSLPAVHRQVLVMKYLDDRTVDEIAQELNRSRVQVQSLLQRARAGLRDEIGESRD